ncbi:MAG: 3-deoxy-8-phosphooctulonate synthase, partial [Pseudomonadota bacterium]
MHHININIDHQHHSQKSIQIGNDLPLVLIAGPCAIESRQHSFDMAGALMELTQKHQMGFIYKSSFDKANRTSISSARGVGLEKALDIFNDLKQQIGCAILTDIHLPEQCPQVATVADVLQIPAFLCRQTDLLVAASQTKCVLNIKKGQFLAPWDMANIVEKCTHAGNDNIMLCERGVSFGYNTLVNDMRAIPILAKTGKPVVFDATHSVQQPGGLGKKSGGQREFAPILARAAVAIGVAAVFAETHQDPDHAP